MFRLLVLLLILAINLPAGGQTVLFQENFNDCTLSSGWMVSIDGNQDFVWYAGTPVNPKCDSTSIDGTCMLVMDDDATGNNTPAFVADFRTPVFDGRGFSTVLLEVDVHYRDLGNLEDHFDILLYDGTSERLLARYDGRNPTGSQFSQFVTFSSDLSLYSQTENMQIIFRYDDAGGYAWWAGIDNVRVTGIGQGSPVVVQTFDSCALPSGWTSEVVTGDFDWFYIPPPSTRYNPASSMNGSCFVLFDDDYIGQTAKPSLLRLYSPWFDGRDYATFQMSFELIFRWYISESFSVFVERSDGERTLAATWTGAVGGPNFAAFERQTLDLSAYRSPQMRVVFEFDDGGSWGWWVGLDNVKISGYGEAHDVCTKAIDLLRGQPCSNGDNKTAMFEGPTPSCSEINSSGIWYRWTADESGPMTIELSSDFNDIVSVFTGDCTNPDWVTCGNRDKYGFKGEKTYFEAEAGTIYYFRVSGGISEGFGSLRGSFCIKLEAGTPPASTANDPCDGAIQLVIGQDCLEGHNLHATATEPYPSRNLRADADVWYTFSAPALSEHDQLRIESSAGFSDVLTLYEGSCQNLVEIATNEYGQRLDIPELTEGETYFLKVAGNFATIEGGFCLKSGIVPKASVPSNNECVQATTLFIGAECTTGTLKGATFSGLHPPCIVSTKRDVWYSFIVPAGGVVQILMDADFKQNATIWSGACNALTPEKCLRNPVKCDGYQKIIGLIEGQTHYLQISATGQEQGDFCVRILDGQDAPPFDPLRLTANTLCIGMDSALLLTDAFNGQAPYTWYGTPNQQLVYSGEEYYVVVRDAIGCEESITGLAPECEAATSCTMEIQFAATEPTCSDSGDGMVHVEANNGNDPYIYNWNVPGQITNTLQDIHGGIYAVTVYDADGCSADGWYTLLTPSPITISILQINDPWGDENNGSIEVSFSGGSGDLTAAWYDKNEVLLSDTALLTGVGMGQYTIVITDSHGCTATQSFSLELSAVNTPGQKINHVEIVPNPARGKAFILIHNGLQGPCDLHVSDPSGRTVQTFQQVEVQQGQVALDIRAYPPGTYFVRIDIDGKFFTKRLLVVRA